MNKNAETSSCENKEDLDHLDLQQDNTEKVIVDDCENNTNENDSDESNDSQDIIIKLQASLDEINDRYLRLSAEFDNYRKRTLKEKAELILNGGEKSITSILPVIDDFERAIETMSKASDIDAIKTGIDLIYDKLMKTLERDGVKVIETKDMPLNTDYHEAIAVIPAPSEEQKGKIIDCVQTGYTLNEKVIRHAKVVVGE